MTSPFLPLGVGLMLGAFFSSASPIVDRCSPKDGFPDAGSKKDISRRSCCRGLPSGCCIRPAGAFSSANAAASSGGPAASPWWTRPLVLGYEVAGGGMAAAGFGCPGIGDAEWSGAFRLGGADWLGARAVSRG